MKKNLSIVCTVAAAILGASNVAFAQEAAAAHAVSEYAPLGVGLLMGVAVLGGTLSQGKAISAGLEAIGRNPSARGDIFTPMLIGLAFVESLVIFALAVAFLKF